MPTLSGKKVVRYNQADVNAIESAISVVEFAKAFDAGEAELAGPLVDELARFQSRIKHKREEQAAKKKPAAATGEGQAPPAEMPTNLAAWRRLSAERGEPGRGLPEEHTFRATEGGEAEISDPENDG